ncbi:MAG TPA: hypothetical protein VG799_05010 [Gemmatimonadota bacterium]|jgi:hypothetical protein|nr:hypothetical protein [Gemmatimonadota bacterium]
MRRRALSAGEPGSEGEGFSYDPERRVLTVQLRPTGTRQTITVR